MSQRAPDWLKQASANWPPCKTHVVLLQQGPTEWILALDDADRETFVEDAPALVADRDVSIDMRDEVIVVWGFTPQSVEKD